MPIHVSPAPDWRARAEKAEAVLDACREELCTTQGKLADAEARVAELETTIAHVNEWTHTYGSELVPAGVDTYGEGVRDCKARVGRILGTVECIAGSVPAPQSGCGCVCSDCLRAKGTHQVCAYRCELRHRKTITRADAVAWAQAGDPAPSVLAGPASRTNDAPSEEIVLSRRADGMPLKARVEYGSRTQEARPNLAGQIQAILAREAPGYNLQAIHDLVGLLSAQDLDKARDIPDEAAQQLQAITSHASNIVKALADMGLGTDGIIGRANAAIQRAVPKLDAILRDGRTDYPRAVDGLHFPPVLDVLRIAVEKHIDVCTGMAYDVGDIAESVGPLTQALDEVRVGLGMGPYQDEESRGDVCTAKAGGT